MDESAIIVFVVTTNAGRAIVGSTCRQRRLVKSIDLDAGHGKECKMRHLNYRDVPDNPNDGLDWGPMGTFDL